jgi:membrane-bound metal-dependent hydrolase YbcI (DUF457 family)
MTFAGHMLTGATIGVLCKPERVSKRWQPLYFGIFLLLAMMPDLPFPKWGHNSYRVSHSIFVNLVLITIVLVPAWFLRDRVGGWRVIVGGCLAWLSHLLLDSFYNHGHGVAIFWPFSRSRLVLTIPWFSAVTPETRYTWHGFREYLTEFACYFPLLLLALGLRKRKADHAVTTTGGDA